MTKKTRPAQHKLDRRPVAQAVALALALALQTAQAGDAGYVVTSSDDNDDGNCSAQHCSLREAVNAATTGNDNNTVTFDNSLIGQTITLTNGEITIQRLSGTTTITGPIDGNPAGIVIDAGGSNRAFNGTLNGPVALENLTITGGSAVGLGGAISANGNLTLNEVTLTGNSAGAAGGAFVNGTAFINNSTLSGNASGGAGGGLQARHALIRGSTFSGNSAATGGGAQVARTLSITNSTFSANSATIAGAAIRSLSGLSMFSSTVTGNSGAGGAVNISDFAVENANVFNSVISQNSLGDGSADLLADIQYANTLTVFLRNSLLGSDVPGSGFSAGVVQNDQGGNLFLDDPGLGPLANNGGPTQTHLPMIDSPLINAGTESTYVPPFDQRGAPYARVSGGAIDIGATELMTSLFTVTSNNDNDDGTCSSAPGHCSLREALNAANANPDLSFIDFDETELLSSVVQASSGPATRSAAGGLAVTITLAGTALPEVTTDLVVEGGGVTIDANGGSGIFNLSAGVVRLDQLTLTGGYKEQLTADENGGAIYAQGPVTLTVSNSTLSGNSAYWGGAISLDDGAYLSLVNSTISDNATSSGYSGFPFIGGIHNYESTAVLVNSTLTNNFYGLGAAGSNAKNRLVNSILYDNLQDCVLDFDSGAVQAVMMSGSNIIGNRSQCELTSEDNIVSGNPQLGPLQDNGGPTFTHLPGLGGAAINSGGNDAVGILMANVAFDQRGAPYDRISGLVVDLGAVERQITFQAGPDFVVSTLQDSPGGLCLPAPDDCDLRGAMLAANADPDSSTITFDPTLLQASQVQGAWTGSVQRSAVGTPGTISLNGTALPTIVTDLTIEGGGVTIEANRQSRIFLASAGELVISELTLSGGTADGDGGALFAYDLDRLEVRGSTFTGSEAADGGAIAAYNVSNFYLVNSTLSDNSTFSGSAIGAGGLTVEDGFVFIENSTITGNVYGMALRTQSAFISNSIIFGNVIADCIEGNSANITAPSIIGTRLGCEPINADRIVPGDPQLGPLADNGGPTRTHLPGLGGVAINAGDNAYAPGAYDQRGAAYDRISGGTIDLGSVELQFTPQGGNSYVVNASDDVNDGQCSEAPYHCSLREAVIASNSATGAVDITFDPALIGDTITLTGSQIGFTRDALNPTTVTGPVDGDASGITVNGNFGSRIFSTEYGLVTLENMTLTGGSAWSSGGAVYAKGDLVLDHMDIRSNNAYSGAAVRFSGTLTVRNSTLADNYSSDNGGAISGTTAVIHDSTLANNEAAYGGAAQVFALSAFNSTFSGNTATSGAGGAIRSFGPTVLENTTVTGNSAEIDGAIFITDLSGDATPVTMTVTNSIISANQQDDGTPDLVAEVRYGGSVTVESHHGLLGSAVPGSGFLNGASFVDLGGNLLLDNPLVGPLADNGGPTLTHAPLKGSPVLNSGDSSGTALVTDQRGFDRIFGAEIDMGSVESTFTPGALAIEAGPVVADETDPSIMLTVTRTGGSDGEVSATVDTVNGTAEGGFDFEVISGGAVTFADGDTTPKNITIIPIDDTEAENEEDFTVVLSSPTGGADLGNAVAAVTLRSDENPGVLSFTTDAQAVGEGVGTVMVTVQRTVGSTGPVTARFNTVNDSAVAGEDFTAISDLVVTFEEGETEMMVPVTIQNDDVVESSESFTVTLSMPLGGATLGLASQTITINDNDDEPPQEETVFADGFEN